MVIRPGYWQLVDALERLRAAVPVLPASAADVDDLLARALAPEAPRVGTEDGFDELIRLIGMTPQYPVGFHKEK